MVNLAGAMLMAAAPVRPVQPVGPVSRGRQDDGAAQEPQRLEVLYARRRGADMVFVYAGGISGQITVSQAWTD